jgi:hypothetical protein
MTTKYFYKGIPIENLINNGNPSGTTPASISPSYIGFPSGDAFTTPFALPLGFGITIGATDVSTYFTAEFVDITATQNVFTNFDKTKYNHIRGIFVGGGGGGGGGGDGGYGDIPTAPSRQRWGSSGGGGGGASYVYLNTLAIGNENNYRVVIGNGGNGGPSWPNPDGTNRVNGNSGNQTIFYLSGSGSAYLNAVGGLGGQTGTSGSNNFPNSASGVGGVGGVGGTSPTSPTFGQFTGNTGTAGVPSGPTTSPPGGNLSNPTANYPAITSYGVGGNGGNAGIGSGVGTAGNAGNPGLGRLYFLRQ